MARNVAQGGADIKKSTISRHYIDLPHPQFLHAPPSPTYILTSALVLWNWLSI